MGGGIHLVGVRTSTVMFRHVEARLIAVVTGDQSSAGARQVFRPSIPFRSNVLIRMQETGTVPDGRHAAHPSPDEPWQKRSDWAIGRIHDDTGNSGLLLFGLWLFCVLWFGGLSLFMYAMRGAEASAQLILGGFLVAGLVPLAVTIAQTRQHVRFRRSIFVMASVPGVVGGRLDGVVELPMGLPAAARVRVGLTCWRHSDNRRFPPHVVWEAAGEETAVFPGPPARVPVAFEIPFESPPSQLDFVRGSVFWVLSLEGTEKARGVHGSFEVPVYVTAASRSAQDGGPAPVTTQPFDSDVLVERSPGVLNLRYQFGPVARFCVVFLPLALPIALASASQVLWAGEPLDIPWTGTLIITGLIVGFGAMVHFTEPMGVKVGSGQVTLLRGYRGWFPSSRVPLSDVIAVNLQECVNHLQQVVLQTRKADDVSVSRVTTVMEARWIAQELRRAIAEGGASLPELSSQPLSIEGSPSYQEWRRRARRRLLFAFRIVAAAVALYMWGPAVLDWFAAQVGIERAAWPPK